MLVSEVRIVTVSVRSLDRALSLYSGLLGMDVIARGALPAALTGPWRMPPGLVGEMALLAAGTERTGMLRLVEFDAPGDLIRTRADLLSGKREGRTSAAQITYSERGNVQGAQFYSVAGKVYELCRERGLGKEIPTEWLLQDIRD